jgi:hypothetical protein
MKPSVSAASRALPWILLGLLGLPLSTTLGLPIKEKGLAGDFVKATRPTLSWDSWFDGSFASKYAAWHNENFGLRSTTIRVYNQEGRWLHGVARANNIEIGTDDVLYDLESIRASRGAAVPEAEIQALADRIVQLERTLDARGISLVVGLAPGKATYWPGNVPPRFGPPTHESAGSLLAKELARRGDFTIDWIRLFEKRRRTAPWPLFPKTGMHWSRYGAARALDDLVAHVERRRGIDMPNLMWGAVRAAETPLIPDDDIGGAMNLLFPIPPGRLAQPDLAVESPAGRTRPSLFVIGDSFFWTMIAWPMAPGIFSRVEYRFYNRERHRFGESVDVPEDPVAAALRHDVVLLLASDAAGGKLGWGFLEAATKQFAREKDARDAATAR